MDILKDPISGGDPVELSRVAPLIDCMGVLGAGDDWWNGVLSTQTVVYGSGRMGLAGQDSGHLVDPEELALCRSLAREALRIGGGPMSSEGDFRYYQLAIPIAVGEPVPERIDEALIRARFGGAILPIATVDVQPLNESAPWWSEMKELIQNVNLDSQSVKGRSAKARLANALKLARSLAERNQRPSGDEPDSRAVRAIFRQLFLNRQLNGPEFRDSAYVAIGDPYEPPPEDRWPPGLEMWPSSFPRLFVGLTQGGSLAGVFSYVVNT